MTKNTKKILETMETFNPYKSKEKRTMKLMVIENHKDVMEGTYYYDAVLVEVKWVDEAGWYCYVIHCEDGSTATFTCGQSAIFQWSDINKRYEVI